MDKIKGRSKALTVLERWPSATASLGCSPLQRLMILLMTKICRDVRYTKFELCDNALFLYCRFKYAAFKYKVQKRIHVHVTWRAVARLGKKQSIVVGGQTGRRAHASCSYINEEFNAGKNSWVSSGFFGFFSKTYLQVDCVCVCGTMCVSFRVCFCHVPSLGGRDHTSTASLTRRVNKLTNV